MPSAASRPAPRLAPSVFFRKVGSEVYVRDTATGEDFLFSAGAAPVFSALRRRASPADPALRSNRPFLRQLAGLGLLDSGTNVLKTMPPLPAASPAPAVPSDIAGRLQETCRRRRRLWSAGLELTWRCNARCRHCYLDLPAEQTAAGELSVAEWLSVVDSLARLGCVNVLVTGGEPTLHPAFLDVCRRIVRRNMLCDVYTNGIDISDALFGALRALPLNSVSVSLYSGTAPFHDSVTRLPGSFRQTLRNLLRFKDAGFDVFAKTPLFRGHLDDYFSARRLGKRLGFPVHPANILVPGHSGRDRGGMMLSDAEYREFLERDAVPDASPETAVSPGALAREPVCHAGLSTLCVTPFGAVRPCNSFPRDCGNVRTEPLSRIWKSSPFLKRLRRLRRGDLSPACPACPDMPYCTVCPGAAWSENPDSFGPCSWSCRQAGARADFNRKAPTPQGKSP